jgi:hypothetical protein
MNSVLNIYYFVKNKKPKANEKLSLRYQHYLRWLLRPY